MYGFDFSKSQHESDAIWAPVFRLLLRPKIEILDLKWHFASYGLSNFIINIQVIELFSLSSFYRAKCSLSHVILQWKRRTPIPQISGNRACQVSFLSLTNTGVDQGFYFGGVGWITWFNPWFIIVYFLGIC